MHACVCQVVLSLLHVPVSTRRSGQQARTKAVLSTASTGASRARTTKQVHTIPYHTIPDQTIPYHTIRYHNMPYRTVPLHIQLTISYHAMPNHTTITYRTVAHLADHAGCYRRRTCTRRTFGSTSSFILAGPKIVIGHTMSVPN